MDTKQHLAKHTPESDGHQAASGKTLARIWWTPSSIWQNTCQNLIDLKLNLTKHDQKLTKLNQKIRKNLMESKQNLTKLRPESEKPLVFLIPESGNLLYFWFQNLEISCISDSRIWKSLVFLIPKSGNLLYFWFQNVEIYCISDSRFTPFANSRCQSLLQTTSMGSPPLLMVDVKVYYSQRVWGHTLC